MVVIIMTGQTERTSITAESTLKDRIIQVSFEYIDINTTKAMEQKTFNGDVYEAQFSLASDKKHGTFSEG